MEKTVTAHDVAATELAERINRLAVYFDKASGSRFLDEVRAAAIISVALSEATDAGYLKGYESGQRSMTDDHY